MRRRTKQPLALVAVPGTARKQAHTARAEASQVAKSLAPNANAVSSEEVLCVIKNTLPESLSLRVSAARPGGKSFLYSQESDLESGGHVAFVGAVKDEITIGTEFGTFALGDKNGRPLLQPGDGLRQASQRNAGSGDIPPWILKVQIVSCSQRLYASVSAHHDYPSLFSSEAALSSFQAAWAAKPPALGEESTVFAVENDAFDDELTNLLQQHGVDRFVLDTAAFCQSETPAQITAKDGAGMIVRGEGGSILVEMPARDEWPALLLSGDRAPLRLACRWQLCYRLQRMI